MWPTLSCQGTPVVELFWLTGMGMGWLSRRGSGKGTKLPGLETLVEEVLLAGDSAEALFKASDMFQYRW